VEVNHVLAMNKWN
jgi:hypothetical protein